MRHKILILSIITVFLKSFSLELLSVKDDPNHQAELAEFATKIFWNECKGCKLTVVMYVDYDQTVDLFFTHLSKQPYEMSIFLVHLENFTIAQNVTYPEHRPDMTIVFLNEEYFGDLEEVIFAIELLPLWNIRGKHLVVSTGVPEDEDDWIQTSFEAFWERQALRVLICFWRDELKLFSYNPFMGNFGFDVSNRSDISEIFTHKIRNMHGYALKMYHFDLILPERAISVTKNGRETWVGLDGMYMSTVTAALNASMEVHPVSNDFDNDLLTNGDFDTPFPEIMKFFEDVYDFDLMMNAARVYMDNDLDTACLYERNDLVIVLPKGKRIPPYLLIFQIVEYDVWCVSFASLLAVSLAMLLIRKCASKPLDVSNAFLDNYRILLNESPPERPRKQQERVVFVLWVMHSIVFATLCQTVFMSALIVPRYYKDMDTIDDLVNAQMNVYTVIFTRKHLITTMQGENPGFLQLLKSVPSEVSAFGESLNWITDYKQENGVILSQEQIYEFKVRDKDAAQGAYHIMKDSAMPNAFCYCIRRDKLYFDELQDLVYRIQDAGLHIHWRDFNYGLVKEQLGGNGAEATAGTGENQVLQLKHLQSAFMFLVFGYSLSLVAFCCELGCYRRRKRSQNSEVLFEYTP